jgi:hypothetical protein
LKDGKPKKMCEGCRAKRTGPRKKDEPATKGAANPSPALIALDVCQAEQILTAILGGRVSLDGDMVLVDAEALATRFPNSADLLPLLIKE